MTPQAPSFTCAACGRTFKWKPELAGRKTRCACGEVLAIPASVAAGPAGPRVPSVPAPVDPPQRAPRAGHAGMLVLPAAAAGAVLLGLGLWRAVDPLASPESDGTADRLVRLALGWVYAIGGNGAVVSLLLASGALLVAFAAFRGRRQVRTARSSENG